jgi:hypothetical protein
VIGGGNSAGSYHHTTVCGIRRGVFGPDRPVSSISDDIASCTPGYPVDNLADISGRKNLLSEELALDTHEC